MTPAERSMRIAAWFNASPRPGVREVKRKTKGGKVVRTLVLLRSLANVEKCFVATEHDASAKIVQLVDVPSVLLFHANADRSGAQVRAAARYLLDDIGRWLDEAPGVSS